MGTCASTKTKGNLAILKISNIAGGATGYSEIELLNKMGGPEKSDSADVTVFDSGNPPMYKARAQTLNSSTFTGEGFSDYANAANQRKLWDNLETDAEAWMQWLYDGTHYRKAQVEVSDITLSVKKDGFNTLTFTAESTGAISYGT